MDMVSGSSKAIDRRLSRGCFRLCSSVVWATGRHQQENQCQGEDSNTSGAIYMYSSHFYLPCIVPWSINLALRGRNVVAPLVGARCPTSLVGNTLQRRDHLALSS